MQLWDGRIEWSHFWQQPHFSEAHCTRHMWSQPNCQRLYFLFFSSFFFYIKEKACFGAPEFANVILAMEQLGRGKKKTNIQVVPIMVFTRHWWASNYRIRACSCTQLWGLLSKFREPENRVQLKPEHVCALKQKNPCTSYIVSVGQRTAEGNI